MPSNDLQGIDVCTLLTSGEVEAAVHNAVGVKTSATFAGSCAYAWGNSLQQQVTLDIARGNAMACGASAERFDIGNAACRNGSGVRVYGKGWTFELLVPLVPPISLAHMYDAAVGLAKLVYARLPVAKD